MAGTRRTKRRDEGWFDVKTLCRVWDVTANYFRDNVLKLVQPNGIKQGKDRRTKLYYARDLLDAWARHTYSGESLVKRESDPLLSGGTSPALEDYRRQKAELAKLDLADRRAELIDPERLGAVHWRLHGALRDTEDRLRKECGPEAGSILGEALDANEIELKQRFGTDAHAQPLS